MTNNQHRLLKLKKRKRFLAALFNERHPGHEEAVKVWKGMHLQMVKEKRIEDVVEKQP